MGIGPTQPAWKAGVLPLNYTRTSFTMLNDYIKIHFYCQSFLSVFMIFYYFFKSGIIFKEKLPFSNLICIKVFLRLCDANALHSGQRIGISGFPGTMPMWGSEWRLPHCIRCRQNFLCVLAKKKLLTIDCVDGMLSKLNIGDELCGCSSMVEHQPSKLDTWVRFPSPAPQLLWRGMKQDTRQ